MVIVDEEEDDEVVSVAEHQEKCVGSAAKGVSKEGVVRLNKMLMIYQDVFRLRFMNDPPVKVTPLKVKLKECAGTHCVQGTAVFAVAYGFPVETSGGDRWHRLGL
jgi:hypothetical protein